ncbi:hypothetical protein [Thalassotalea marina]|uniref:Uncharacterized protein n=1 Tax=Thalassotalea marina TaxID=1673741 RepID=A0A919EK21_9GAMM|nr:hypothetical protein [Thalassotalea marina]GHF90102.1 hypothetical protein GCM10017161_17630 [Thalassotalea marina]
MKKKIIIGSALAVLTTLAAVAGPMYWHEKHYYATSAKQQIVGEESLTCTGLKVVSGEVTPYWSYWQRGRC